MIPHDQGIGQDWTTGGAEEGAACAAAAALTLFAAPYVARAKAPYELPKLPYPDDALQPTISANTIGFHYGKHHKAYVDNLNKLLAEAPDLADLSLEELIRSTAVNPNRTAIFNNAAQAWRTSPTGLRESPARKA